MTDRAAAPDPAATPPPAEAAESPESQASTPEAAADGPGPDGAAVVREALGAGPATSFEIARRIDQRHPGFLGQREGCLLPLLLEMRRSGDVSARWVDRRDGRRRVYSLGADPVPDGAVRLESPGAEGVARRIAPAAMRRFAADATAKLAFAPGLGEEARAEIVAHLLDLADANVAAGAPPETAAADAIRTLGDPWKVSTDLSRAAQSRRTVLFPRTVREALLSLAVYDLGVLLAIVATILFVRAHVVAAYHIPTKSMEPTLHGDRAGGDRILVLRVAPAPKRFDIEVFEGWGKDRKQYVKRCIGLPGESVGVHGGDLFIDGRLVRKEATALDAMLFPMFDIDDEARAAKSAGTTLAERVLDRWAMSRDRPWKRFESGAFEAEGDAAAEPSELRFAVRLTDASYDEETAEFDDGVTDVGDGRVALDVGPVTQDARVLVRWSRGAERYDAVLRGEQPGVALRIDGSEVARRDDVSLPLEQFTRVRFSFVDRVLRLEVGGKLVLRHDLPEPASPRESAPAATVSVRVSEGRVRVRPVRVERDVHWTSEYEELDRGRLGDDEYFMMGDNSWNSQDSRSRGPVRGDRLVGRPLLIVWPLSRFRILR